MSSRFIQITSGFLLTAAVWLLEWDKVSRSYFQVFLCVVFLLSQQTGPRVSPKVYKFNMWFWNTYWQSLVQKKWERKHYGPTLEHLACAYFSPNTAELTGTSFKGTHLYWKVSYCLRGFVQKCHSGFSYSPFPTISVPRALELKVWSHDILNS